MSNTISLLTTKPGDCFICPSTYWHRNLHSEKAKEIIKVMSSYEMEKLPRLWSVLMFKNHHFCEHVYHSWLNRSVRGSGDMFYPGSPHYDVMRREALRLSLLLENIISGIGEGKQITDFQVQLYDYTRETGGRKHRMTFPTGTDKKLSGTWFGLAESLIEQYSANLELDDVHEREMRMIMWKHFALALAQHLVESSPRNGSNAVRGGRGPFRSNQNGSSSTNTLSITQI